MGILLTKEMFWDLLLFCTNIIIFYILILDIMDKAKADILLLDMIMAPGIDGLESYKRILKLNPKQKAVIASGFSETPRVKEAIKLGVGAYVKKPYLMEKIGLTVRGELDKQNRY